MKTRLNRLAILFVLGLSLIGAPAWAARVYIDINQPFAKKIPVAVPDFLPLGGGTGGPPDITQALPKRLGDNLDMTGMFIALDKRTFLESNARAGLSGAAQVDFKEWLAVGTELLVKGGFTLAGEDLVLELRLYDCLDRRMLLGKRYTGHRRDGRKMINRFTNEILFLLTGEQGIFGTQLVFVAGTGYNKSIMRAEFGGEEATGVAGGGGPHTMPTISAGGQVAWVHRNGTSWELISGGQVISAGPLHLSPAFTPGGALLAAISGKYDTNIFMFPGPGAKPVPVTTGYGINISPTVSPDGGRMAFVSDRGGSPQIYTSSTGGGPASRLTTMSGSAMDPDWSPRGDRIVFSLSDSEICTIAPDGSDPQQLTSGQGRNSRPSWSPDGRMIAFSSSRNGRNQIFVMTANGERQQPLMPDYGGDQQLPYWSKGKADAAGKNGG
ncbi:MAG: hypothetical protein AB1641_30125 [Thermodesulfobacteriota bacterium]